MVNRVNRSTANLFSRGKFNLAEAYRGVKLSVETGFLDATECSGRKKTRICGAPYGRQENNSTSEASGTGFSLLVLNYAKAAKFKCKQAEGCSTSFGGLRVESAGDRCRTRDIQA
jgi:hypothetical protein